MQITPRGRGDQFHMRALGGLHSCAERVTGLRIAPPARRACASAEPGRINIAASMTAMGGALRPSARLVQI